MHVLQVLCSPTASSIVLPRPARNAVEVRGVWLIYLKIEKFWEVCKQFLNHEVETAVDER